MVRVTDSKWLIDNQLYYAEIACLHADTKPTAKLATGSVCIEVDTGDVFLYDEASTTWNKVGG